MMNDLNVEINNFGPIRHANIKIGKINVVSGYNATGKSTISKLLYCIFKATSEKRQDFAYESIKPRISSLTAKIEDKQHFLFDYKEKNFKEIIGDYENAKNDYIKFFEYDESGKAYYLKDIETMDYILNVIKKNGFELYKSILRSLIQSEFLINNIQGNFKINGFFNNEYINYISDFTNNRFSSEGNINFYDVYYIDSFSLIDLFNSRRPNINNYFYTHDEYLKKLLQNDNIDIMDIFDNNINRKTIKIENKLRDLINGEIKYEHGKFIYYSNDSSSYSLKNISLSVKQIGIIQMLLSNRELKENSLLIIDEPELHLHPRLQDGFAEILVVLVCCLNVVIYINTYSSRFLDSLSYYQAYYNFKGSMNFYLTEPSEMGKFNLKEVDFAELFDFMSH